MKKINRNLTQCGLMGLFLLASTVHAHTFSGALTKSRTATAKWKITCSAPPTPTQMIFRIEQAKKNSFSVKLNVTAGSGATNEVTTDSLKMVWTPFASTQGGAGDYILTVSKVGTKPDQAINYTVEAHCATDSGEHTGESNPQRIP